MASSSKTAEPTPTPSSSTPDDEKVYSEMHERMKRFYKSVSATGAAVPVQFINLATVNRRSYRARRKKDVYNFVQASIHGIDGYYETSEKIHFKDILNHDIARSGKRVLITGAPGCGKTTLSRQLCRDLYSQAVVNEYGLVLLVELRRLKVGLDSVEEDIDLQYLLKEFKRTLNLPSLCQLLEDSDGEGVALILDGYDEIADQLGNSPFLSDLLSVDNPYLNQCDVLVTTRPSRCSDVLSLIQQPHCHVEILGFTDSNIDSYINSFFRGVYGSDRSQAKSQEVIHRLKTVPLVREMCRIPRVLQIVCKVQDQLADDPLPKTISHIFSKYICYQLLHYLKWVGKRAAKIQDVLQVPGELFPGFHSLCEVAYKCCTDERGQRLILTDDDLGDLKQYLDERGSVYNLLFSEYIDEECTDGGLLYQFIHKAVMETLAAVYIAKHTLQHQELIWKHWFPVVEMAGVWRAYCGLTRLEHINLPSLSFSSLSKRAREVMIQDHLQDDNMLVMMSLYEANNRSVSGQVLQAVFKSTIHAAIKFPYDFQVVSYAISHQANLHKAVLKFQRNSESLTNLFKSDLKPLNESIRNLKAIDLEDPPVETVLSALSGQVEELRLTADENLMSSWRSLGYWKSVGDALEASHCLRSLHFNLSGISHAPHELSVMIEGLCRNERLTELTIDTGCALKGISTDSLKSLLVPREKCRVGMPLTCQQWCVVLSGLKGAKKLKELCVDMRKVEVNPICGHEQADECLITSTELEELVATDEQLVKVDVGCYVQMLEDVGDLVIAMLTGVIRNNNISELRIAIEGDKSKDYLPSVTSVLCVFVETLAHNHHITCVRFEYSLHPIVEVLGDKWCDLLVTGPMSRPVCHLGLNLAPAEWGLLLSRVHNAKQLEELSLEIWTMGDEKPVAVQAVEGALSNCRLRKLRINAGFVVDSSQWPKLFGAILRGITANHNEVDFVLVLHGGKLDGEHLMSQLPHLCTERFEVIKRKDWSYIILQPPTSTESVQRSPSTDDSDFAVDFSSTTLISGNRKRLLTSPSSQAKKPRIIMETKGKLPQSLVPLETKSTPHTKEQVINTSTFHQLQGVPAESSIMWKSAKSEQVLDTVQAVIHQAHDQMAFLESMQKTQKQLLQSSLILLTHIRAKFGNMTRMDAMGEVKCEDVAEFHELECLTKATGEHEVLTSQLHLKELCWFPFGIQNVEAGPEGGQFFLGAHQPVDSRRSIDSYTYIEVPAGAVEEGKIVYIDYGITPNGPFSLPDGYKLCSMVVYLSVQGAKLKKPVILHIPHWVSVASTQTTNPTKGALLRCCWSPHTLEEGQKTFKFSCLEEEAYTMTSKAGEISISGDNCLFADVIQIRTSTDFQYEYHVLREIAASNDVIEKCVRIVITFSSFLWQKVVMDHYKPKLRGNWQADDNVSPEFTFEGDKLEAAISEERGSGWAIALNRQQITKNNVDYVLSEATTASELKEMVERLRYPPAVVCHIQQSSPPHRMYLKQPRFSYLQMTKVQPMKHLKVPLPVVEWQRLDSRESSMMENVITSAGDLVAYYDKMTPHLTLLGTVLGMENQTAAVMGGAGCPQEKCIKILRHWIGTTSEPTWQLFCDRLKRNTQFNGLRGQIECEHLS